MDSTHRPFATGSKPGPDAIDHYLEKNGFYRKHVARDASSLFRVVSEYVFDIQNFHEKIRQDCAAYMEARKDRYANDVDKNFFNYISQIRRSRTHGTLLELRVLSQMYKRNVIIFEPTQNLQTTSYVYVKDDAFDHSHEPMRVFFSQKDKHFDIVYKMDYAKSLAYSQSIVYDILYSDVFKLPDVKYAVERMLHDQEEQVTLPLPEDPSKYKTHFGEIIPFDSHQNTNCVLKDPKTCHFHNQEDFEEVLNDRKDAITIINQKNETGRMKIFRPVDGFLYVSDKSCVRQLLAERITPFPYKVAKALDPSIYRNTEFELWSENRKEHRLKWLDSADFSSKPHSQDKWQAYDCDRCYRGGFSGNRKLYETKIEKPFLDEVTYMSLDDDLKKKYIILDSSPYKMQNLANMDHFLPSKDSLELTVFPVTNFSRGGYKKRGASRQNTYHNSNNRFYHSNHSDQHQYNVNCLNQSSQAQMINVSDIEHDVTSYQESQNFPQEVSSYDNQLSAAPIYQPIQHQWNNHVVPFIPQQHIPYGTSLNYLQVMPYGNFTVPPPTVSHLPTHFLQTTAPNPETLGNGRDLLNLVKNVELSSTTVNWKPKESTDQKGSDLPLNDVDSLRFYYNLGVRYFLATGIQPSLEGIVEQFENIDINNLNSSSKLSGNTYQEKPKDVKAAKSNNDEPPVPANTPVSEKTPVTLSNSHGHRYEHNTHNMQRRSFGLNRDTHRDGGSYRGSWNAQSRKEIKFNSNVRNANKGGDIKASKHSSTASQSRSNCSAGHVIESENAACTSREKLSPNTNSNATAAYSNSPDTKSNQAMWPSFEQNQQQFYQTYAAPQTIIQSQPQETGMAYQISEDGNGYMVHHVQQPMQYSHQYQYAMSTIQPGHVYYPVQNYPAVMDGSTLSSNDSGVVDNNMYHQGFQQAQVPYYSHPTYQVPMYFTQSPLPQTAPVAPIFTVPIQQQAPSQQISVPAVPPVAPLPAASTVSDRIVEQALSS